MRSASAACIACCRTWRRATARTAIACRSTALETLRQDPEINIALVDVMMPEMDGYVTVSRMREIPSFGNRPIIALTAKAMKGDREKCISAGASDYIAKPVNNSHLLAMLRTRLGR